MQPLIVAFSMNKVLNMGYARGMYNTVSSRLKLVINQKLTPLIGGADSKANSQQGWVQSLVCVCVLGGGC